jgi:hypothetical protein
MIVVPGHLIGITGLPGEGKSYFARSARELGKTLVALTDPKEAGFYGNEGVSVFSDLDWRPHLQKFDATALTKHLQWLDARMADDSQYIVVDTGSEVSDLAVHEVLKIHNTNDMRDVPYGRAYTAHDAQMKTWLNELRRLVVRGKTVIVTFHAQLKERKGDAKKEKGMDGTLEWSFDEQMLPALNTSYRQRIHSAFDLWLYTKPMGFGPARQFQMIAIPDNVRPAKHSVTFKPGTNPAQIPNTLRALLGMIEAPQGAK